MVYSVLEHKMRCSLQRSHYLSNISLAKTRPHARYFLFPKYGAISIDSYRQLILYIEEINGTIIACINTVYQKTLFL